MNPEGTIEAPLLINEPGMNNRGPFTDQWTRKEQYIPLQEHVWDRNADWSRFPDSGHAGRQLHHLSHDRQDKGGTAGDREGPVYRAYEVGAAFPGSAAFVSYGMPRSKIQLFQHQ